jgi:hypothetical protein
MGSAEDLTPLGKEAISAVMDVPILTAVIGVSGTLLGTIVGGCLTTFTNVLLQKRREQAEFRIGCRLIDGELQEYEGFISSVLETKRWWSSEVEPGTKAWEEHQHVLASYLSYEAWCDVRMAIMARHFAHHLSITALAAQHETIDDTFARMLADYVGDIQKGRASLNPYLYLLDPLRLRPRIPGPSILWMTR